MISACVGHFDVVLLLSMLATVLRAQTVTITNSNLTPSLGTTNYMLQCVIVNFVAQSGRALAWTKDGDLVGWDRNVQGGFNGYIQESGTFPIVYSLHFYQVDETHGGVYKCLIADGQPRPSGYTEVASDQITVQVPYFPHVGNPVCSPNEPTIAVAGTQLTMTCSSLPGFPDEVNLVLRRSGQHLSSGQNVNDVLELKYTHTVSVNDIGTSFTCVIVGTGQYNGQSRTCNIGPLEIVSGAPRVIPSSVTKSVGQDATFTCELSSAGNIQWYTEPASFSSEYSVNGNTFTLTNVQLSDNSKVVVCKVTVGGASVESRGHLMVVVQPQVITSKPLSTPARNTPRPNQPMPVVTERSEDPTRNSNQNMRSTVSSSSDLTARAIGTTTITDSGLTQPSKGADTSLIVIIVLGILLTISFITIGVFVYKKRCKDTLNDKDTADRITFDVKKEEMPDEPYASIKPQTPTKKVKQAPNAYERHIDATPSDRLTPGYSTKILDLSETPKYEDPITTISQQGATNGDYSHAYADVPKKLNAEQEKQYVNKKIALQRNEKMKVESEKPHYITVHQ